MEKLVFIVGQLNIEIRSRELDRQKGCYCLTHNTQISIECRAVQQANYCKQLGMNVILLGRVGEDFHGKMIQESLIKAGISTNYIEEAKHEHTGINIEILSGKSEKKVYFDPGANLGDGDFKIPIEYYLHLCDAVIVNKWCNYDLRQQIFQAAQLHLIPNIYVHSGFPGEDLKNMHIDYLFLDLSNEQQTSIETLTFQNYFIKKGVFIFNRGEISVLAPSGEHVYKLTISPELDANYIVTLLVTTMNSRTGIDESALFKKLMA
jgi:pfkB family carbohydrate kinase